ncbi:hypothetical protein FOZ60_013243 [Perkinsus olseni]|uniref:Uncharacterized protein n=1 Tax=Perkinsus olseni TaxID=32597 RepID=A0A7J6NAR2_PEROL|nr:hypothetical protein FOZ60_013243 [Perkinsus olseni]
MALDFAVLPVDDSYPSYWGSAQLLHLTGGPGTYSVNSSDLVEFVDSIPSLSGDYVIRPVELQDGDLTELSQYNTISFKTILEGKEVTFFRRALDLAPGSYVFYDAYFALKMEITTKDVMITFSCEDYSGELVGVQHEFRISELIVGELTNAVFGGGADYIRFIGEVAATCPSSEVPTEGSTFIVIAAREDKVYLELDGVKKKVFTLDNINFIDNYLPYST